MAHTSKRLSNSFSGALAGGGDPSSSPLYVFGPFLRFLVVAGVAGVSFGASVWLVVLTVVVVSLMYRQVIQWVTDGTGGSGLTEEEFGPWAVKVNSSITFVEYTLTFLVSLAALVTLMADRFPALDQSFHGFHTRTVVAIALSLLIGWVVNRGPKAAARAFGPATFGVLLLLWVMIVFTIARLGFHLPDFNLRAFTPPYLRYTLSGFSRLLALMTGIEVFANLVAAYEGTPKQRSRMAFQSLLIAMGTTCATMLIVGPAILALANPEDTRVSVFTQAMDKILPQPLPYLGTLVGVVVLASAAAASAQGLQNLALGLRYRNYVTARMGLRNEFEVADLPVWIEVGIVCACFAVFGTQAEIYLSLYAVGVFVLLSMTGWAAARRTWRQRGRQFSARQALGFAGVLAAALLTTIATVIIFLERFTEGAWAYFLLIPLLYVALSYFRRQLGEPVPLSEHLGRLFSGQYLLPYQREGRGDGSTRMDEILVSLDSTLSDDLALQVAGRIAQAFDAHVTLLHVSREQPSSSLAKRRSATMAGNEELRRGAARLEQIGIRSDVLWEHGRPARVIPEMAHDIHARLIVMTIPEHSGLDSLFASDVAEELIRRSSVPVLILRRPAHKHAVATAFRRMLVALDGSRPAEATLRYAERFAEAFGSDILLLAVPEADNEKAQLEDYLGRVAKALQNRNLPARALVTGLGPARTIAEVCATEQCNLVILAESGRGDRS
ncbi:MAG TPA: universal stress protein [Terracidiphilus sp.]|nr:universal stress protein [Terracidiphilus sp.]